MTDLWADNPAEAATPPPGEPSLRKLWLVLAVSAVLIAAAVGGVLATSDDETKPSGAASADGNEWVTDFIADGGVEYLAQAATASTAASDAAKAGDIAKMAEQSYVAGEMYDKVADMASGSDDPLAVQSLSAFTGCSTAFHEASSALSAYDTARIQQATGKIQTCTADLDATTASITAEQ